jgi:hypothetical protein
VVKSVKKVVPEKGSRTKDVAVRFEISSPALDKKGNIVVQTNFSSLQKMLAAKLDKYKSLKLTDDNIAQVEFVKKECRDLRVSITKDCDAYLAEKLNLPVNMLKMQKKAAVDYVTSVETNMDSLLEQYDQTRIDALNATYELYRKQACKEYSMPDTTVVAYDKTFYLKGAGRNQKELRDKIFLMVRMQHDACVKHDNDVKCITQACGEEVDAEPYISQLAFRDVSAVLVQITAAKERLSAAAEEAVAEDGAAPDESMDENTDGSIDVPDGEADNTGYAPVENPARKKVFVTKTCELTYEYSFGETLTRFFHDNGVRVHFLRP